MLSDRESARYSRQMMLDGWGNAGQEKLKSARVVVAGAGGLGSVILLYLAAAGVGRIRIIDSDRVDTSNLNRQVLYAGSDIGREKALAARDRLAALNPDIRVEGFVARIDDDNVSDLVGECPMVDAMDNLHGRLALNRLAVARQLPLFHGAIYAWEGRATTVLPGKTPCLQCLYQGVLPGQPPVAGVTPGAIGCVQASEVIKYLLGMGDLLAGRMLLYDGLAMKWSEMRVRPDPDCPVCGKGAPR